MCIVCLIWLVNEARKDIELLSIVRVFVGFRLSSRCEALFHFMCFFGYLIRAMGFT